MIKSGASLIAAAAAILAVTAGCGEGGYYTMDDYGEVGKIDAHVHYCSPKPAFMEQAKADNMRLLTIDTDGGSDFFSIRDQEQFALAQEKASPGWMVHTTAFELTGWNKSDWLDKQMAYIKESLGRGAVALKVWKNIGMEFRDKDGKFVMIDNPRFDPIFDYLKDNDITLVGHIGEPRNCWLPLDQMTVNNDRDYFSKNPQYHMFLHPEYPSYEEQVGSRDNMLRKHPGLKFVGCHLASLEWSLERMAAFFDEFPLAGADLAHRVGHIQYLALEDYDAVREFFIKYQDRILYGSDTLPDGNEEPVAFKSGIHETWMRDWKYFATDEKMTSPYLDVEFRGLHLSKTVIDKIFRTNAEKWYPGI
jgi:predicted TIM-barrel fold metal-dependent hydrolase